MHVVFDIPPGGVPPDISIEGCNQALSENPFSVAVALAAGGTPRGGRRAAETPTDSEFPDDA